MILKLNYTRVLKKSQCQIINRIAIQNRLVTTNSNSNLNSNSTKSQHKQLILPTLNLTKLQEFKSFNFIPNGVLITDINKNLLNSNTNNESEISIDKLAELDLKKLKKKLETFDKTKVSRLFHLIISNLDYRENQSKLEKLTAFYLQKDFPVLPLTYIPLLNNLTQNENYSLWLTLYLHMKRQKVNLYREELISELVDKLLPSVINSSKGDVKSQIGQGRIGDNVNYFNITIGNSLNFDVLTDIVEEYSQIDRIPNTDTVKKILNITRSLTIGGYNLEQRKLQKARWITSTLNLLLKSNNLRGAYTLFNDQLVNSTSSFNAFLSYYGKIWNRDGLELFWDKLESSKNEPNLESYKLILDAYFNMRDLRGVQLILDQLTSQKPQLKLDKDFVEFTIQGFCRAEPKNLHGVLKVIKSELFLDAGVERYELALISLVEYAKINQMDYSDELSKLFVKELDIYLTPKIEDSVEGEESDIDEIPTNTVKASNITPYFDKLIKLNQDPLDINNNERFLQTLATPLITLSYPSIKLQNLVLNALLKSLTNSLFNLKQGDKTILINCIELIQQNCKEFMFSEEIIEELNKLG
jgi:hypothetical protein